MSVFKDRDEIRLLFKLQRCSANMERSVCRRIYFIKLGASNILLETGSVPPFGFPNLKCELANETSFLIGIKMSDHPATSVGTPNSCLLPSLPRARLIKAACQVSDTGMK